MTRLIFYGAREPARAKGLTATEKQRKKYKRERKKHKKRERIVTKKHTQTRERKKHKKRETNTPHVCIDRKRERGKEGER